jgi:hypothetical protein
MNVFLFFSKVIMYRKKCVWHKVFPFLFTTLVGRFSLRYLFSELCLIYARDTVTHVGVKCPVLLPEFYQNWIVSANFSNISHYKWHENPFSRLALWRCGQRRCSNGFESFTGVDMCLFVLPCRPASCPRSPTKCHKIRWSIVRIKKRSERLSQKLSVPITLKCLVQSCCKR